LADVCFELDLDKHLLVQQASHQNQRGRGTHVGEPRPVDAADRVTVDPVDDIHAGSDHVTDRPAEGLDGTESGVEGNSHLRGGVASMLYLLVHDRGAP